ncbi:dTDP-4-dehydrorhamnose 3,5-epimerase [Bacillus thuringiensis]|uniref:dTDP-4-dehydrorhamnose 3,5-epimerase n=1 Tax=Bacillus cereus TaxID=1396 RepID=A0AAW7NPU7_BACCE|nr:MULTISPECIES: dTDP-4-dehydrorhamnose 3,5-epimerase [Bacillus cereus group]EJQ22238.1 dTDP-4-dehydrorhamnose 3,5-epimerase [Bacillus cereus BAG4X12-1]EJQ22912.1 dTDP-4-dehydrorhamnose 3,5-epimerase [Bacillus cereus BAG4X12-1]EOP78276.1 dTDP-4-dehydrorhamnose 3,5-epimerase [Bacillus cereus BAG5X12-1]MBV6708747.1 dTDP-4-dehydrorhamnose 3,5-epimerase [Bacillus thuringiensis]MCJ0850296.1 dTDP-4-dehydrorhamnose 3,5-epimerase [Bacillus cereus]
MRKIHTALDGVFIIELDKCSDKRGYFIETYNKKKFELLDLQGEFVQDNQSLSVHTGTIRGLHYQLNPKAQMKVVSCISGSIYDVVVDIRKGSPTYGQWFGTILSEYNNRLLTVPKGFAHGFCTIEPNTIVQYKVDEYYSPNHEKGILWNDETIGIFWPTNQPILSEKDRKLPRLKDTNINFVYGDDFN